MNDRMGIGELGEVYWRNVRERRERRESKEMLHLVRLLMEKANDILYMSQSRVHYTIPAGPPGCW